MDRSALIDELRSPDIGVRHSAANDILDILQPVVLERDGAVTRTVDPQCDGAWWFDQLATIYRRSGGKQVEAAWLVSKLPADVLGERKDDLKSLVAVTNNLASLQQLTIAVRFIYFLDKSLCGDLLEELAASLARLSKSTDELSREEIVRLLETMSIGPK